MAESQNDTTRVVVFLNENDHRAWKSATITERLGLDMDAIGEILFRLKERDLVRHKNPEWTITDDEDRLRAAYRLHRHHEAADDQYGEERLEELRTDDIEEVQ